MAIEHYGGPDLANRLFRSGHSARLIALQNLASGLDDQKRESVGRIVEQLREFNRRRNHIAHNPLVYAMDKDSTANHKYGAIIDASDAEQRIGLDEISALAEHGESLAQGFSFTFMMIMGIPE